MDVRLTGSFTATGGRASKIIVLVMTDAQFAKWQSSHSPTPSTPANGGALYNSGEVSQAKIDLHLPDAPANYHLVFSNVRFPYPKAIQTRSGLAVERRSRKVMPQAKHAIKIPPRGGICFLGKYSFGNQLQSAATSLGASRRLATRFEGRPASRIL